MAANIYSEIIDLPYSRRYQVDDYRCYHGNCGDYFLITATDMAMNAPGALAYNVLVKDGRLFEYLTGMDAGQIPKQKFNFIKIIWTDQNNKSIETIAINNDHAIVYLEPPTAPSTF